MTRDEVKKLLPVMQSFAEGKTVQCRSTNLGEWHDIDDPAWCVGAEYRIKPEVVKVTKWACYWIEGGLVACTFDTELCAKEAAIQNNGKNSGTYISIKLEGTYEH